MSEAPELICAWPSTDEGWQRGNCSEQLWEDETTFVRSDVHLAALAAARAEERERCARIADSYHEAACKWASMYVREFDGLTDSARIAAAIRTTEQEGEG